MSHIRANIKFIKDLAFKKFSIPPYQRPYRWQTSNVEELLNCIRENMELGKSEYRIGSIILHSKNYKNDKMDIVDGQQRLTTLSLIFRLVNSDTPYTINVAYRHLDSKQNIYRNYRCIKEWFVNNNVDRNTFADYILMRCSVVQIEANEIGETFQMFDSQNGRGKPLEAYNLLKAYHIRAIDESQSSIVVNTEKIELEKKWEHAVEDVEVVRGEPLLKYLINDLYRIRTWGRFSRAYTFNKRRIKEFKGIQIHGGKVGLPLENISLLIHKFSGNNNVASPAARTPDGDKDMNPFVNISMPIVNGRLFFEYVQTFVTAYKYLFAEEHEDERLQKFQRMFRKYCAEYSGSYRQGDTYVRDVYIALCLAVFDKFGLDGLMQKYNMLYALTYRERLEKEVVFYETMAEYPKLYFGVIMSATSLYDLTPLTNDAMKDIRCSKLNGSEDVLKYIIQHLSTKIYAAKSGLKLYDKVLRIEQEITLKDFE